LEKLSGDELEALMIGLVGESRYLRIVDYGLADLELNHPAKFKEWPRLLRA
jgi:hypothetical protein